MTSGKSLVIFLFQKLIKGGNNYGRVDSFSDRSWIPGCRYVLFTAPNRGKAESAHSIDSCTARENGRTKSLLQRSSIIDVLSAYLVQFKRHAENYLWMRKGDWQHSNKGR